MLRTQLHGAHCTPPRPSCSTHPCQPNSLDETQGVIMSGLLGVDKHIVTVFVALNGTCV